MTTPTDEQVFDLDSVFDNAGGGDGAPSFEWPAELRQPGNKVVPIIGGSIVGEITDIYVTVVKDATTKQPKVNKNGKQMPQVNLTVQTELRNWQGCKKIPLVDPNDPSKGEKPASEDTGERRIYVKYRMLDALARAIKASDQKTGGPRKGAKVAVKLTELIENGSPNPLPDYEAQYRPPVSGPADNLFDQAAAAAPAAPPAAADPWSTATSTDEPPF